MRRSLSLASIALASLAACGGGGASATPDADEALACIAMGRGQTFAVGLAPAMAGASLSYKLMSADPAPPGFNDNTWIVQINAADGTPVVGADLRVTPFMPDHQHGTLLVKVQELGNGQYKLTPINMWMPGYWTITLSTTTPVVDSAVYKFCIQA